jgi:hypothetical protein
MTEQTEKRGKGKATPSRKEAEAARKNTLKVPADKKAARKAMRDRDAQARIEMRRAMYTLDEKSLPYRDRGPVKKFIRDYVDTRLTVGEMFVPFAFLILIVLLIPNQTLNLIASGVWAIMFAALAIDSIIFVVRVRKQVRQQFGEEEVRGVGFYALTRSITFRPMRLPKPVVKVGGEPKQNKIPKSLQK